jgi:type IV pilus assembly protein PilX
MTPRGDGGLRHPRCRSGMQRSCRRQRGVSLITALLFMVATLVLGVSVMSISVMQERMIGNTKDRGLAMQAAEAALRDAELDIRNNVPAATAFKDDCTSGLCTPPSQRVGGVFPSPLPVYDTSFVFSWKNAGQTRRYGQYTAAAAYPYPTVAQQPVYVIERLGTLAAAAGVDSSAIKPSGPAAEGVAYRITARAVGARADTIVMLQSIYSAR